MLVPALTCTDDETLAVNDYRRTVDVTLTAAMSYVVTKRALLRQKCGFVASYEECRGLLNTKTPDVSKFASFQGECKSLIS